MIRLLSAADSAQVGLGTFSDWGFRGQVLSAIAPAVWRLHAVLDTIPVPLGMKRDTVSDVWICRRQGTTGAHGELHWSTDVYGFMLIGARQNGWIRNLVGQQQRRRA